MHAGGEAFREFYHCSPRVNGRVGAVDDLLREASDVLCGQACDDDVSCIRRHDVCDVRARWID